MFGALNSHKDNKRGEGIRTEVAENLEQSISEVVRLFKISEYES